MERAPDGSPAVQARNVRAHRRNLLPPAGSRQRRSRSERWRGLEPGDPPLVIRDLAPELLDAIGDLPAHRPRQERSAVALVITARHGEVGLPGLELIEGPQLLEHPLAVLVVGVDGEQPPQPAVLSSAFRDQLAADDPLAPDGGSIGRGRRRI